MIELTEAARARFAEWGREFHAGPPPQLDKSLVHKYRQGNVFVSRIERTDPARPDEFVAQFTFDPEHSFFFEHPQHHVPGLMLIEAGRQFGNALAHLFYEVPLERAFILGEMRVKFNSFAELSEPIFGLGSLSDKRFKRGQLVEMNFAGQFVQSGKGIGFMEGVWNIYDKKVIERMRRSAMVGDAQSGKE